MTREELLKENEELKIELAIDLQIKNTNNSQINLPPKNS